MSKLDLTPARLRVLRAVAAKHVKRNRWRGDVHAAVHGPEDCCGLRDYQSVKQQVTWLVSNELIRPGESTVANGWVWEPTDAGRAALDAS